MKKTITFILAGIMCFSFTGCGGQQAEDTLHKTISIVQNNNSNRITAENDNYIFFYSSNKIMKMSKNNSSVETVYTFDGGNLMYFNCIEYFDDALYMIGIGREFGVMQLATVGTDGTGMNKVILEDTNQIPNFYTWEDNLYLDYYMMGNDRSYIIKPETLELTETEREYRARTKISDGSIFVKNVENGLGKLYKTDVTGNTVLFSDENKSVFMYHVTDHYVFYILIDPVTSETFKLYRCDIDGCNEKLIKEIPAKNLYITQFDNTHLYVSEYKGPVWKINKETLETTDISTVEGVDFGIQEVNNEKLFYSFTSDVYHIDTVTGEKTEF